MNEFDQAVRMTGERFRGDPEPDMGEICKFFFIEYMRLLAGGDLASLLGEELAASKLEDSSDAGRAGSADR